MITLDQAQKLNSGDILHHGACIKIDGPRGGVKLHANRWRVNGKVKFWKTRPGSFRIPIKAGLYAYHFVSENNAHAFHLATECDIEELRNNY